MAKTIQELIDEGRIKVDHDRRYQMLNAVINCYRIGGVKGLWLDGIYYPVQKDVRKTGVEYEAFDVK
jgi:hypothetical protein